MSGTPAKPKSAFGRLGPGLALAAYVGLIVAGAWSIVSSWQDIEARRELVDTTRERVRRLAQQGAGATGPDPLPSDMPADGAYLAGERLSVASADLQRRVTGAVTRAGGTVLSSQLERQEAKDFATGVEVTVECDINQPGLQRLVYELETTAPFLFIDALSVKARNETRENEHDPRLREIGRAHV